MSFEKKKIKLGEEKEKIVEMGQESEIKAAKAVIELSNEAEKRDQAEEDKITEILTKKRKFKSYNYKEALAAYMNSLLKEEGIPPRYHYMIEILDKGLGLAVWSDNGRLKATRKLLVVGEPKYDRHAAMLFAYWAGDIIYKDKKTGNGLIL